jgi:hypothetical protein
MSIKISPEEFILRALKIAQKETGLARIHIRWDGLDSALRKYYGPNIAIDQLIDELVTKGIIQKWTIRGGLMIVLLTDDNRAKPKPKEARKLLAKIKQFEKGN